MGSRGSAVAASDADQVTISSVFLVDDFTTLDADYWTFVEEVPGLTVEQIGGEIKISGTVSNTNWEKAGVRSTTFQSDDFQALLDVKMPERSGQNQFANFRLFFDSGSYYFSIGYHDGWNQYVVAFRDPAGYHQIGALPGFGDEATALHTLKIVFFGNTARGYVDDALVGEATSAVFSGPRFLQFQQESSAAGPYAVDVRFDNYALRSTAIAASQATATGSPVVADLVDPATSENVTTLTFQSVTTAGETSVQTSSDGTSAPAGFQLGSPPITYDISTSAIFAGPVEVCVSYGNQILQDEPALKLFHFESGAWADVTTTHDMVNDVICGNVTTLSPFVVAETNSPPAVVGSIADRTFTRGGDPFVRDLDAAPVVFNDTGASPLTYVASSSDPGVVVADVAGSVLTVTPAAVGSATITLDADDGSGGTASTSFAVTVIPRPSISFIAQADLPVIDGDVSEWEALFGPPHLGQSDFINIFSGTSMPETDQKVEVWLGWNDQTSLIYVAGRVTDDAFGTTTSTDPWNVWKSDNIELFIDADNSGGGYSSGNAHAQQYVFNPGGAHGLVLFPHALTNPPETQAVVQQNGTVYTYELAIPGWNSIDASGSGTRHTFLANQAVGLEVAFADFESDVEADATSYHAYNSLNGASGGHSNADVFTDFRLAFPSVTASEPTPTGTDVATDLTDPETGESAATLTFDNVTVPGETSLETTTEGPPPPDGFQLGDPPISFDLSTTAEFAGAIDVCFSYAGIFFENEANLKMFHFENDVWTDVTSSLDTGIDLICGSVTTLSPFGLFQNPAPALAAITASERVTIDKEANVSSDVYSGDEVRIKKGDKKEAGLIDGSITAVGDVRIERDNRITGDVTAGGEIKVKDVDKVTIEGTVSEGATVDLVALPPVFFSVDPQGAPDVKVKKNKSADLAPNGEANPAYGALKVDHGGTVTLHSGIYYFEKVEVKHNAELIIQLDGAPITINVKEKLDLDHHVTVTVAGGDASDVLFNVSGAGTLPVADEDGDEDDDGDDDDEDDDDGDDDGDDDDGDDDDGDYGRKTSVKLGHHARFVGTVYAPHGLIKVEDQAEVEGALIGRRVELEKNVIFVGSVAGHLDLSGDPLVAKSVASRAGLSVPERFEILPNYPNPFNPETTIRFALPEAVQVRLDIYDVLGQRVRRLVDGNLSAGLHQVRWNGRNQAGGAVSSGVYLYHLQAGETRATGRMLLLR